MRNIQYRFLFDELDMILEMNRVLAGTVKNWDPDRLIDYLKYIVSKL